MPVMIHPFAQYTQNLAVRPILERTRGRQVDRIGMPERQWRICRDVASPAQRQFIIRRMASDTKTICQMLTARDLVGRARDLEFRHRTAARRIELIQAAVRE